MATCLFVLASCGNSNDNTVINTIDEINGDAETKQKYVIELNMDNYKKYIDIRIEDGSYSFYGSLTYAYYDNVNVSTSNGIVSLTAGGYGYWYKWNGTHYKINNVSGRVIFWI